MTCLILLTMHPCKGQIKHAPEDVSGSDLRMTGPFLQSAWLQPRQKTEEQVSCIAHGSCIVEVMHADVICAWSSA